MNLPVNFDMILEASERIKPYIHKTPVLTSQSINEICDTEVYFKCENFQRTGSFKYRGACNAVFSLDSMEAQRGVVTDSSGNHAAAISKAAGISGIPAYIVMPSTTPMAKRNAVKTFGGHITLCEPILTNRLETLKKVAAETGATMIHHSEHPHVIAGQGTSSHEFLNEIPDLDFVLTSISGGGLLSGTSITVKHIDSNIKVIGCEPKNADDAYRSLKEGKIVTIENPKTIADGLRMPLGENTFSILRHLLDEMVLVSEEEIVAAMRLIWERLKIIIEPSSAVAFAPVLNKKLDFKGKKVGVILSGGNVDLSKLPF